MFHLHVLQSLYSPEGGKNRPVIPLFLFEGMYWQVSMCHVSVMHWDYFKTDLTTTFLGIIIS